MDKFISADSHVVEPNNLYTERMDRRFRHRAPRFESRDDADYLIIDGLSPRPSANFMGGFADQKLKGEDLDRARNDRYSAVRPGAYDPAARLADQDSDGIAAEVVYPGMSLMVFSAPDPEYKRECLRVYNNWLGEFCSAGKGRLIGVGALPTGGPIEWAISEAHRIAKMGMAGAIIPMQPERPFQDPYWEPLFEVLPALSLRPNFHTGVMDDLDAALGVYGQAGNMIDQNVTGKMLIPAANLTNVVSWGIPQKYPNLTFVGVEQGIGWIAGAVRIMDKIWEDHHTWMQPRLEEPPSFYVKRQFYFTFEDDRPGILTRDLIGVDRLMWGSDYPHPEGTFPRSRKTIERDFAGIPAEDTRLITGANARRLYGIAV